MSEINGKIRTATKWSIITELAAKLVAPISTMVLARVLNPEAFGVLVTATMVISFAEIFTDAGYQKYLVQHEFDSDDALYKSTTVAFWSNLVMSIFLLVLIWLFSDKIAEIVGNQGYGHVISVSSICIPLAAFSSIQMSLFKRKFDFKTLFYVRLIGVAIPVVVTIPLAFLLRSYWALILGMIALYLSNAVILTWKSEWKPKLWYNWNVFKEMFSFTFWSLIEAISIWLTSYVDIFLVGKLLNDYYLGIYRTSMTTVAQLISIITAATTPVLFSSLSRLQNDKTEFTRIFLKFQKLVGLLIIPLGVGIYIFRNLITEILLGPQWTEAAFFIGIWALTSALTVVLAHYSSECYRALGKPKLSVIVQVSHILVVLPVVWWAIPHGFHFLCEARALVRFEIIIVHMIFMAMYVKISPIFMIRNIFPALTGGIGMLGTSWLLRWNSNILWETILIVCFCYMIYLGIELLFPKERQIIFNLKDIIIQKRRI